MRSVIRFLLLVLFLILFVACTAQPPVTTPTRPITVSSTPRPLPTQTPTPTSTLQPTVEPSPTTSLTPTNTPLPAQDAALEDVELIGLAWYDNYDLLLSFQFPGPVQAEKYQVTLEDKTYQCEVLPSFADRLYCRGQGARVLAVATVRIFSIGNVDPGFEKEVWVPYFNNNYDTYNP